MASTIRIAIVGHATDAIRALRRTRNEAEKTNLALKKLGTGTSVFGLVAKAAASKILLIGGAAVAALPTLLRLGNALLSLGGLLVALPAVALSLASVFGALKIATHGVGEAISAGLSGDLVGLADAMHKLPPAARTFVTAVVALRKPIDALRARVTGAFFKPFMKDVGPLAKSVLPVLSLGLARVAQALGGLVHKFATAARSSVLLKGMAAVFKATAAGLKSLGPMVSKLVTALGHLLTAGVPAVTAMYDQVGKLGTRFADWLIDAAKSGKLKKWLAGGMKSLGQIWRITRNLIGVFKGLFRAAGDGSGDFLGNLEKLTARLSTFLNSDAGQRKMKDFFAAIDRTVHTIWITVKTIAPILVQILTPLGKIATWASTHEKATKRIVVTILAIWAAWKIVTTAIATARAAMIIFNAVCDANPIGLVVLAVAALAAVIYLVATKTRFFQDAWKSTQEFFADVPDAFGKIGQRIIDSFVGGLKAGYYSVRNFFRDLTRDIPSWKGPESVDKALLFAPGQNILRGLIDGLTSQLPALRTMLGTVTSTIDGALSGSSHSFSGGALKSGTITQGISAAAAPRVVINVNVAPGANLAEAGRMMVDALQAYERRTGRRVLQAAL